MIVLWYYKAILDGSQTSSGLGVLCALCHCHVVDTAIQKSTESNYLKLPSDEFNANIVIINVQLLHVVQYFYCSAR